MIKIRCYTDADFDMVAGWWRDANLPDEMPPRGFLSESLTRIAMVDDVPVVCCSLLPTHSNEIALLEGLIATNHLERRAVVSRLVDYLCALARELQCKRVYCFTKHAALAARYADEGFAPFASGLIGLSKSL